MDNGSTKLSWSDHDNLRWSVVAVRAWGVLAGPDPGNLVDLSTVADPLPEVLAVSHQWPSRASGVSGARDIAVIRNSLDQPGVAMNGGRWFGV